MTGLCIPFPGIAEAEPTVVGGKGASLIRLVAAGLPVPPGAVLTTAFFEPWFEALRRTRQWAALVEATPDEWAGACEALKGLCPELAFDETHQEALSELRSVLGDGELLAVRSSSPEEDLPGASFAGGYETLLGVRADDLEGAIRECFASSLDERVLVYKREQGFDPLAPRIAVVVQQQVDSEVAGVGFSLNPVSNDYDEAVFDASWGLGETVVSGAVSPDHFVVSKVSGEVLDRKIGDKQTSLHLLSGGGSEERQGHRCDEATLADTQLAELTEVIGTIEELYGAPVDIEWAYAADGALHLLQARPVTAWVPLHPEMLTEPGERRRLYMDIALSGGFATNAPISPMGQSWMSRFAAVLIDSFLGGRKPKLGKGDELWMLTGHRMYQDLSNILWLTSPKQLGKSQEQQDALMAAILANIDKKTYRSARRPAFARLGFVPVVLRLYWGARGMIGSMIRAFLSPKRAKERLDREVSAFRSELASLPEDLSIPELQQQKAGRVIHHVWGTMPVVFVAMVGVALAEAVVPPRWKELADRLGRGFSGNEVVEMGIALYRMAGLLSEEDLADPGALAARLRQGDVPSAFLEAWESFVASHGWRGPNEVDLAAPKYGDEPVLALSQMCAMSTGAEGFDPEGAHARHVEERRQAYEELMGRLGPLRRAVLRRAYQWLDLFGGMRDTPKHDYLMLFAAIRRRAVVEGEALVAAGRLDEAGHVFDLTLDEIEAAKGDPDLDLRDRREENTRFLRKLRAHVRSFPAVIDSRGRILRPPPRPEEPGQLTGMPVSPGTARGPVKVLRDPHEKPVELGDVLVAHTTDPGWTPLFVNAAAVVLSVGGVMQHGAAVAREYGKPCVAGIDDLLERLEDGQLVEVDGSAGVVRLVEPGE